MERQPRTRLASDELASDELQPELRCRISAAHTARRGSSNPCQPGISPANALQDCWLLTLLLHYHWTDPCAPAGGCRPAGSSPPPAACQIAGASPADAQQPGQWRLNPSSAAWLQPATCCQIAAAAPMSRNWPRRRPRGSLPLRRAQLPPPPAGESSKMRLSYRIGLTSL